MRKLLSVFLCSVLLGCIVGVNLTTAEDTIETWIRSYNDRDTEGIYITLSKEYVENNGGETVVKDNIETMLANATKKDATYELKSIGQLAQPPTGENATHEFFDIYLARINKKYTEDGEKKSEEIILNFEIKKEDEKYKIVDYWD